MDLKLLSETNTTNNNIIKVFSNNISSEKTFYLIGGVHGDEPESVFIANKIKDEINKLSSIPFRIIIIPQLNPDGIQLETRKNANRVDLNRNFPSSCWKKKEINNKYFGGEIPANERENILLINLFKQYPPYLILSIHAWTPFINCSKKLNKIAQIMTRDNEMKIIIDDIPNHETSGSLDNYAREKYNCPVITFEVQEGEAYTSLWGKYEKGLMSLFNEDLILDHFNEKSD